MNAVGRQGQKSGASAAHHQRQYSDNYLDSSSIGRWLQSSSLQHLQSSSNAAAAPAQQVLLLDFGYYGGGGQGSRMYRNTQRNFGGESDLFSEPLTPPGNSRYRKNGEEQVSPSEFSPGLLDLHSFDTELIPEIPVARMYEAPMYQAARGRSVDDSEAYVGYNKQSRARGVPDNSLLKSFAPEKEKASNVAKIKSWSARGH